MEDSALSFRVQFNGLRLWPQSQHQSHREEECVDVPDDPLNSELILVATLRTSFCFSLMLSQLLSFALQLVLPEQTVPADALVLRSDLDGTRVLPYDKYE